MNTKLNTKLDIKQKIIIASVLIVFMWTLNKSMQIKKTSTASQKTQKTQETQKTTKTYSKKRRRVTTITNSKIYFMPSSKFFRKNIHVKLMSQGGIIRYTLDGSLPSRHSKIYTKPLFFDKSTVLRAQIFDKEGAMGLLYSKSYFLSPSKLPLVSLITDPGNLFDVGHGIYRRPKQRGKKSERVVTIEYFNKKGKRIFQERAGLRIHGRVSRKKSRKKSFRLYFRKKYGRKRLKYKLFADSKMSEFDCLVLRSGNSDTWTYKKNGNINAIFVKDQLIRILHQDMGHLVAHGIWVQLYINGAFWGLYNLTERIDEDFLQSYARLKKPAYRTRWNLTTEGKKKNSAAWKSLIEWAKGTDFLQDSSFKKLAQKIDLENFISYVILNLWVQNEDWHVSWYAAQKRPLYGQRAGKWRFLMWDGEISFSSSDSDFAIELINHKDLDLVMLFDCALKSKLFRHMVVQKLETFRKGVLSEKHVLERLQEQLKVIKPLIVKEAKRWNQSKKKEIWIRATKQVEEFIATRWRFFEPQILKVLEAKKPISFTSPNNTINYIADKKQLAVFGKLNATKLPSRKNIYLKWELFDASKTVLLLKHTVEIFNENQIFGISFAEFKFTKTLEKSLMPGIYYVRLALPQEQNKTKEKSGLKNQWLRLVIGAAAHKKTILLEIEKIQKQFVRLNNLRQLANISLDSKEALKQWNNNSTSWLKEHKEIQSALAHRKKTYLSSMLPKSEKQLHILAQKLLQPYTKIDHWAKGASLLRPNISETIQQCKNVEESFSIAFSMEQKLLLAELGKE